MLHLHGCLVDHQARADRGDQVLRLQAIGAQGIAGVDHVDDLVGEVDQRRQLHRTVQFDDVDLAALLGIVALGYVDELGGNPQAALGLGSTDHACGHQLAAGDLQVQRLIQALAAVLHQHVLARHTEVGGTMLDIGRHVGGAHDQQTHVVLGGWNDQLAALVRILGRHDTGLGQQWQGIVEDAAFGKRDGQHWNVGP
ncbi:hypothetical protein D3C78_848980 [compost metagenome]